MSLENPPNPCTMKTPNPLNMRTPNPCTMRTPLILLIFLTTLYTATGDESMETHHLFAAIGSSVSFPGLKIDNFTFYDLRRTNGLVVVTCHGDCNVRDPYTQRGRFYQHNGTFLLTQLRKEDSGIFEYKVNFTVKGRIHLRVMAPVLEPALKQEVRENGTQCLVTITCQAKGDGLLSFTILRNDKIFRNVTSRDNSTSVSMDGWDPETSGIISCMVANAVSFNTTPTIELPPPVKPGQMEMMMIVIGLFLQWGGTVLYRVFPKCSTLWQKWRQRNGHIDEGVQDFRTLILYSKALTMADNIFGFIKESLAVYIFAHEHFIPVWCWVIASCFLLCRTIYWIIILVNSHRKTRVKFSFFLIKGVCAMAMCVSSVLGVPAFCVAVLVVFNLCYSCPCPCRMTYGRLLYVLVMPIAFLGLCFLSYMYMFLLKKKAEAEESQPEDVTTQKLGLQNGFISHVPNGGTGQPEDNSNPNCEEHLPGVVVDIPNGDQENPEQEASCENPTEGGPGDHLVPKPEEGQLPGSLEIPCKSNFVAAPNHEDPDDTEEDTEGQCLLTAATKVVALDKDRVANG